MRSIWNKIMNLSIRNKFVVLVYSCVILLFIILSCVLLFLSGRYAQAQLQASRMETVKQINSSIEGQQQSAANLANFFSIDPQVQSMLQASNRGGKVAIPSDTMRRIITYSNVNGVAFFNKQGQPVDYVTTDGSGKPVNQLETPGRPLESLYAEKKIEQWEYLEPGERSLYLTNKSPRLCYWRMIRSVNTMAPLGSIAISFADRRFFPYTPSSCTTIRKRPLFCPGI